MPPRRRPGGRKWGPFQGNGGRSGETAAHALRPTRSRWRRRPREAVLSDGGAASRRSRLGQATLMGPHSAPGPPRCARPGATPGPCSLPATHGAYRAGASARQSRQRAGAIGATSSSGQSQSLQVVWPSARRQHRLFTTLCQENPPIPSCCSARRRCNPRTVHRGSESAASAAFHASLTNATLVTNSARAPATRQRLRCVRPPTEPEQVATRPRTPQRRLVTA